MAWYTSFAQPQIGSCLRNDCHNCYMELHRARSRWRPPLPRTRASSKALPKASSEASSGTAYEIERAPIELPRMTRSPEVRGSRSSEFVASRQISDPPRIFEEFSRFGGCSDRESLIDTPCYETWVNNLLKERSSLMEAIAGLPFSRYTWVDTLYALPSFLPR
jgi:hypothetical protein